MPLFFNNHLIITNRTEILPYTSNQLGRTKVKPRTDVDRIAQGNSVLTQFTTAVSNFNPAEDAEFVYLVFKSPINFLLDLERFDKSECRLATYKTINTDIGNEVYYEATVYLNKNAISKFLRKIEQYILENTPKGKPQHQSLIANIEEIRAATLKSFWQEPETPFPNMDEEVWWEVWLNRLPNESIANPIDLISDALGEVGVQIKKSFLIFPEHYIYLMKATATRLSSSLLYTDRLSEIRKPRETADFFTSLEISEQDDWIADLVDRISNQTEESLISVCLLDTGLTIANPLLVNVIHESNLDAVNPAWSKNDTRGHGTAMAGLALFGDLTSLLASNDIVQLTHHIESVKLIESNSPHDPELYGAVTQEAIARAVILNPSFKRQVCLAITYKNYVHKGRPSSWSAAIDQTLFGSIEEVNENTLVFVSSGNLPEEARINYPLSNDDFSIEDPGQSFNAITVGAYTLKDSIDLQQYNGAELLARRGAMSPCNSTSVCWDNEWSKKPDIVMEGGNQAIHNGGVIEPDSLQLLSTAKGRLGASWLRTFGETSGATALASKFSAELYAYYPTLWPETIRALIIHSADWTSAMLDNRNLKQLSNAEKEKLISRVGYGIPNLQNAKYSASNSLSLVIERTLKPYKKEDSRIQTDEFNFFELPWPVEALEQLHDTIVKLKITLSYFIEPNPGRKQYNLAESYRSHSLRFKMIDSNESVEKFKARISKDMREETYVREGSEHWLLGNKIRDKGSIHKDIWEGTAAELATRNKIAVHPIGGWWKRTKLNRYENAIRYSLIVTIQSPNEEIDLYTPVLNQISIEL